jgi:hypothetical protein
METVAAEEPREQGRHDSLGLFGAGQGSISRMHKSSATMPIK